MIYHVSSGLIRYHPSDPSRGKAPSPREGAHCPLPGWHAPGTRISAWSTGWYQSISCFCWCMLMPWSHCPKKWKCHLFGWVGAVSLWIKKGNYGLNCIILYKDLCLERVRSSQHENGLWTASIHWTWGNRHLKMGPRKGAKQITQSVGKTSFYLMNLIPQNPLISLIPTSPM